MHIHRQQRIVTLALLIYFGALQGNAILSTIVKGFSYGLFGGTWFEVLKTPGE